MDGASSFKEQANLKPAFYHLANRNRQNWLQKNVESSPKFILLRTGKKINVETRSNVHFVWFSTILRWRLVVNCSRLTGRWVSRPDATLKLKPLLTSGTTRTSKCVTFCFRKRPEDAQHGGDRDWLELLASGYSQTNGSPQEDSIHLYI